VQKYQTKYLPLENQQFCNKHVL